MSATPPQPEVIPLKDDLEPTMAPGESTEPVTPAEPVPTTEPATEPITEPVTEPITEPVTEPTVPEASVISETVEPAETFEPAESSEIGAPIPTDSPQPFWRRIWPFNKSESTPIKDEPHAADLESDVLTKE